LYDNGTRRDDASNENQRKQWIMEINDEELRQLGERVVALVDDEKFREDHLSFKLLVYLLVSRLRDPDRTRLSARFLQHLTGIASGHQKKVIERLQNLGYIDVQRSESTNIPSAILIKDHIATIQNEKCTNTIPQSFTIGVDGNKRYRITVVEEVVLPTDTKLNHLQLS
jgi:hypothetical protein